MVIDRSLGTLAAVESMLFCISFIDRHLKSTRAHIDPTLHSHFGKHYSKVEVNYLTSERSSQHTS